LLLLIILEFRFDSTGIAKLITFRLLRKRLKEIRRVLKSGGTVVLGFSVNSGQPRDGVTRLLASAGLTKAQIVDRPKLFCAMASKL
jgi:ubiquinone/menaquinone biosynthesis C-methylase UbiE